MDIGVPYRDLGKVDVSTIAQHLKDLPQAEWLRNPFRQEVLAYKAHAVTESILLKHEWHPAYNSVYFRRMEECIEEWARRKGIDASPYLPIAVEETDLGPIYTFPEWRDYEALITPLVDQALKPLRTPRGIVTRLALVKMLPEAKILPHKDLQPMSERAHRIHVTILSPPGVSYKLGGKKLVMRVGRAYDFNNRIQHSVTHRGKLPRVNLFIDYYPDPGVIIRNPLTDI